MQAYDKLEDTTKPKLDWMKKNDPMEYLNVTHPNNHTRSVC